MKIYTILALLVLLVGCSPKPDKGIILWEQPDPISAARLHVGERAGLMLLTVLPTGSMEPFLTGGDVIVLDTTVSFNEKELPPGTLCNYLPKVEKLPYYKGLQPGVTITHVIAAWSSGSCIMNGIHNAHYENGALQMSKEEYRGKVIQVYTKRVKP